MNPQSEIEALEARLAELKGGAPPASNSLQTVVGGPFSLDEKNRTTFMGRTIIPAGGNGKFTLHQVLPEDVGAWWAARQPSQEITTNSVEAPGEAAAGFQAPKQARTGPKGREIYIISIGPAYEGVLKTAEYGSVDAFETASEAAELLGVSPQFLHQEIKKQAGKPFTVRGVTMQYSDLYIADDSNFSKND